MVEGAAPVLVHGQPGMRVSLPNGDHLTVLLQGAQVLSWVSGGRENLFLSAHSRWDGHSAVRGGVPICFPQFNQRGPLPKHGFARNLAWQPQPLASTPQGALRLAFTLSDSELTRRWWPESFHAIYTIDLSPACLQLTLDIHNPGPRAWAFTGALHTYLAVDDIRAVALLGLGGQPEWNAVTDGHGLGEASVRFTGEFDRVYQAAALPLNVRDGPHALQIEQGSGFAHTVVWNPGAVRAAELPDLARDHVRMLCVEAAQVLSPVTLKPGEHWQGWQRLSAE